MRDRGTQLLSRFSPDCAGFVPCPRKMALWGFLGVFFFYVAEASQEEDDIARCH